VLIDSYITLSIVLFLYNIYDKSISHSYKKIKPYNFIFQLTFSIIYDIILSLNYTIKKDVKK